MKIKKSQAVAIFTAVGFSTAAAWTAERMQKNIKSLPTKVAADVAIEDAKIAAGFKKLHAAAVAGEEVEVVDDAAAPAEAAAPAAAPKKAPAKKPAPAPAPVAEEEDEPAAETEDEPADTAAEDEVDDTPAPATKKTPVAGGAGKKTAKAAAPAKPAKPAKPPKPAAPTTPGVRNSRSRPYLAGVVIKKHGLQAGVTDAMVAELDEAYGKANPAESMFCMRNAWHAIRGYTKGSEADLTQTEPAAE